MADTPTPPTEKSTTSGCNSLCRLWTLTLLSLTLNGLIILALIAGAIIHHHHKHHGFDDCGRFEGRGEGGFDRGFHHFHGAPWADRDGDRPDGMCSNDGDKDGHGMMDRGGMGMHNMGGMGMMGGMHNNMGGMPMMGDMNHGPQGAPDPAKMADMMLNHLSDKLTLTDDEKAKIKPILEAQADQMQKDMEARRSAMVKSMEDTRAKIKPLLTPDQQKQLDALPTPGQKPAEPAAATQPAKK